MSDPDQKRKKSALTSSGAYKTLFVMIAALTVFLCALALRLSYPPLSQVRAAVQTALNSGNAKLAIEKSRTLVAREPDSSGNWILLARAGALMSDAATWQPAMDRVHELSPREAYELYFEIGSQEMRRLHAAPAEFALRKATTISASRPQPWRLLVQLLSVQGRPRETAESLLALIQSGDFESGDLQVLAWPNSAISDPARVDALLAADPENRVPQLSWVGAALNENRSADAETILKSIVEQHPDCSRAIALLGQLLADRDGDEFLAWQRELSSKADIEPETWVARGVWLRQHNQMEAAAKSFRAAVERDPRHLIAISELGRTLQTLGESTIAKSFLEFGRRQQQISELAKRTEEQADSGVIPSLVQELQGVGRLWEASAWCRLYLNEFPRDKTAAASLIRIQDQLRPDLPRTLTTAVPGADFDWARLADPVWSDNQATRGSADSVAPVSSVQFHEESLSRGVAFRFENGQPHRRTIVQTSGGGVAAFDFDRDGWCDLYFVQEGSDPAAETQSKMDRLFRNTAGHGFRDITDSASIHEDRFGQGVAAADFDNDGFTDLYVANVGLNRLLRNNGDGTFQDITSDAGLTSTGWNVSTAIVDLNGDGAPELLSIRYATGPEIFTRTCRDASGQPGVCRPTLFPGEPDVLALSSGDGRFIEQSGEAGLDLPEGRGFGLIVADYNDDGRLDFFVANDQTANFLMIQDQTSPDTLHFSDDAILSGVAFDRDGFPQACMGIASDDLNGDGRPDLFITNFASESATLYLSQAQGGYQDVTRTARLRDTTFAPLGFGTQFCDADLDGHPDLIVLNGHITDGDDLGQSPAMRPQLFRGLPNGQFEEILQPDSLDFFRVPRVGRGLCVLDWNRDGLPDFAGSFLDGNAALGTNQTPSAGHWLTLEFAGISSSRDAIGARVRLVMSDGTQRRAQLTAGDGFAASNQRRLHWGLGQHSQVERLEIQWPSGQNQVFRQVRGNAVWLAVENKQDLIELRAN